MKMKKTKHLNIRVDDATMTALKKAALDADETVSDFVVKMALKKKVRLSPAPLISFEDAKEIIRQLSKIGTNINNIAHSLARKEEYVPEHQSELKNGLKSIYDLVATISEKAAPAPSSLRQKKKEEAHQEDEISLFEDETSGEVIEEAVEEVIPDTEQSPIETKDHTTCPFCGSNYIAYLSNEYFCMSCSKKF